MRLEEMKRIAAMDIDEYLKSGDADLKKSLNKMLQDEVKKYVQIWIDAHDITDYDADGIMPSDLDRVINTDLDCLADELKASVEHVEKLAQRVRMLMR